MKKTRKAILAAVISCSFVPVHAQTRRDTVKTKDIETVVVTALGIKRKPKELSYSVTPVKSEDITATNTTNAAQGMVGKVSGLQINVVNNGVSPDTRVVLRGNRSLLGNNQALIVVDGFPAPRGILDRINPNDIQEVTVLKGANASALYGSEAANGVLIITTKKGRGKLQVNLNSSVETENVSFMPKVQDQFGAGGFPDFTLYPLENVAWGPRYDGRMVAASETYPNGDVWMVPYSPIKNNHKSFFETGMGFRNGITLSSSSDTDSDILLSLDRLDKTGVVPNDEYSRTNVRLNANKKVGKLEFGGNVSFFTSKTDVVSDEAGRQDRPLYWRIFNTPLHIPLTQMKNWRDGYYTRNEVSYYRFYENPYFIVDTQRFNGKFTEFLFVGNAKYDFNDWISATFRAGYTSNNNITKTNRGAYTYAFQVPNAYNNMAPYGAQTSDFMSAFNRLNTDLIISIDKEDIAKDVSMKANVGQSVRMDNYNSMNMGGTNLIVPNFWNVSTRSGELTGTQYTYNYRKVGVFADVTLGYKNWLFINGSVRNDWSSSLSKENRSFFYPGGGISIIVSEALPGMVSAKGLTYLKLSGNLTKSGNDPVYYANTSVFTAPANFPYSGTTGLSQSSRDVTPDLRPEFTKSMEAGLEFGLFKSRITGNVTVYKTNTTDQIIPINVSTASGASSLMTNVGEVENKGLEIDLSADVVKTADFRFNLSSNFSTYTSEVVSLSEGVDELSVGGYATFGIVARKGEAYPQIKVTAWERDPQGRVIVDAKGDPIQSADMKIMGKTTPDFVLGLNTTLQYKNLKLYMAGDYRKGGVFYNNIVNAMEFAGLTQHSVTAGRLPFVFPNSVYSDGKGGYIVNTDRTTSNGGNTFWSTKYAAVAENYVTDASYIKIREISLSYDFNKDDLNLAKLTGLSIGVYTRNPFMFLPKENVYTDPEFNYSTGNVIGIGDQRQSPPTRTIGLKVSANF